jgi:16S rRNA (cytidine1402-2'-O)-methyltransferase
MALAFGDDRPACVVRELTKMFEEIAWGTLHDLHQRFSGTVKGEIVIVVGGAPAGSGDMAHAVEAVNQLQRDGIQLSVACATVAKDFGLSKRELYQAALAASA